jgi:hypothetical protein
VSSILVSDEMSHLLSQDYQRLHAGRATYEIAMKGKGIVR